MRQKIMAIAICTLLGGIALQPPTAWSAEPAKAAVQQAKGGNASAVVNAIRKAAAATAKAAKMAKLDSMEPQNQAFFAALKKVRRNAAQVQQDIERKDKGVDKSLHRLGRAVAELKTGWSLTGRSSPRIETALGKMVAAANGLNAKVSQPGRRQGKGGELSAKEKAQYAKMQAQNRKAKDKLQGLRGRAGKDKRLLDQIDAIISQIIAAESYGGSVADYLAMQMLEEALSGTWYAVSTWVKYTYPDMYAEFAVYDSVWVEYEEIYYESYEEVVWEESEWSSFESETSFEMESYEVEITETEVTEYEEYIETTEVEVTVDEYDIVTSEVDEELIDRDDDGVSDFRDDDDDNDGVPDVEDSDDDGDGIPDDDNDGVPDEEDADDDGDGVSDDQEGDNADEDTDQDGVPDQGDPDDDNDGAPDEGDADGDGDGVPDDQEGDNADEDANQDDAPGQEDPDDDNEGGGEEEDAGDDGDGAADDEEAGADEGDSD